MTRTAPQKTSAAPLCIHCIIPLMLSHSVPSVLCPRLTHAPSFKFDQAREQARLRSESQVIMMH